MALVIAESLEQAQYGASLLDITYTEEIAVTDIRSLDGREPAADRLHAMGDRNEKYGCRAPGNLPRPDSPCRTFRRWRVWIQRQSLAASYFGRNRSEASESTGEISPGQRTDVHPGRTPAGYSPAPADRNQL